MDEIRKKQEEEGIVHPEVKRAKKDIEMKKESIQKVNQEVDRLNLEIEAITDLMIAY